MFRSFKTLLLIILFQTNMLVMNSLPTLMDSSSTCQLPIGTIVLFGGDIISRDWLLCDGSTISRLDYFHLFLVIGTLYGTGDHIRTFNLPDFRGRFPLGINGQLNQRSGVNKGGTSQITLKEAQIPSHTHDINGWRIIASGAHAHSLYDPGHNHGGSTNDGSAGEGGRGTVNGGGFHDRGRHAPQISTDYTRITVHGVDDHAHNISGTLGSYGRGIPVNIMNPYQTINYIIYAGPRASPPSIG